MLTMQSLNISRVVFDFALGLAQGAVMSVIKEKLSYKPPPERLYKQRLISSHLLQVIQY